MLTAETRKAHAQLSEDTEAVQSAINDAFHAVAVTVNEDLKLKPLYDDRAEELVAAIYRYVQECRKA